MEGQELKLPAYRGRPRHPEPGSTSRPEAAPDDQQPDALPAHPAVRGDVAALVFRRAAEIEQDRRMPAAPALPEDSLVEIGREVGLSPAAVRQALGEYHAGLLPSPGPRERTLVGPRTLVIERTVPGPLARVEQHVHAFLQRKLFDPCRRTEHRSVWRPRAGLLASIQRAGKRLGRDRTLDDVTEIIVSLAEIPPGDEGPGSVRVCMEVECQGLRRGLGATVAGGMAVSGSGAVAAAGAAVAMADPLPLLGLPPLGALAAGAYLGPRGMYRKKLAEVEFILQGELDALAPGRGWRAGTEHG